VRSKGSARATQRKGLWLLLGAGLVIVAVVAGFVLLNGAQQPAPGALVTIPTVAVAQNVPFPNVARVTVEDAHVMAMTGDAVIVDVRDKPFYDASHVRGALSLPLGDLPARASELPKDKAILTYCT
jgi:hypothetical protein